MAPSTITSILKKEDAIRAADENSKKKRFAKGEFPDLENALVKWMNQARNSNVPVGGQILREKAKFFATRLGISNEDFRCSDGWFDRFKKRNNIKFKKVCGESASVSTELCSEWKAKLKTIIQEYEAKNIFNADETGLFFKCLPDRSMCFKGEKCHGGKSSKERITLLLAANMDGSEKLKPLMIGKSAKPRCFKNINSFPMAYRANKKAWMTSDLFNEWVTSINAEMEKKNRRILLFIDNCTAHNNPPHLSHVAVEFLPPNTTSILQPLDQGVIKVFKSFYRTEIVQQLLDSLEENVDHKISLLSAMYIADKSWKKVSEKTIRNCFRTSGFIKDDSVIAPSEPDNEIATPNEWNRLTHDDNPITFQEFVSFDDDVAVAEMLSEDEILNQLADDVDVEEEEEPEEEEVPNISHKEAKKMINRIRHYLSRSNVDDNVFNAIHTIDIAIDNTRINNCVVQTTMEKYLKKK